ncbi:insecticidal delta-endotoxin [Bacillus thuringiensis]|uniref:insecticidal delta-endotoxin n=1 Tax=Bacillus thuringiensis TaxID=1428 RepID=UPI001EDDCFEB|nr:insecticidal delta-endotoxin [Bacillus thuringiensis]
MSSFYLQQAQQSESLQSLENKLTHPPSLFTWLKRLSLYTIRETFNPTFQVASLSGLKPIYSYTHQQQSLYFGLTQRVASGTPQEIRFDYFVYKLLLLQFRDPNNFYPISGIPRLSFYISEYSGNQKPNQDYYSGVL